MKTTTLLMDHYQHTAKGMVVHKAGTRVSLPDQDVEYIHQAVLYKRLKTRKAAARMPGTPEYDNDR